MPYRKVVAREALSTLKAGSSVQELLGSSENVMLAPSEPKCSGSVVLNNTLKQWCGILKMTEMVLPQEAMLIKSAEMYSFS